MSKLKDRVFEIIKAIKAEFATLPKEERKHINKFLLYQSIVTIQLIIEENADLVCPKLHNELNSQLRELVFSYTREFEPEKIPDNEKSQCDDCALRYECDIIAPDDPCKHYWPD